jgi:hypothetical protein
MRNSPHEQRKYVDRAGADVLMMTATGTPDSSFSASQTPGHYRDTQILYPLDRSQPEKLQFLQLADWDERNSYDEDVPSCLHYSIEWKVSVNKRVIAKDTEQDLVLAPTAHWHMFLKPKIENLLQSKLQSRPVTCEDTNVTVSVTDRSERDLVKRFDGTNIDWSIIERQLVAWGKLFRKGKKLRIEATFNYKDSCPSSTGSANRGPKRGSSATQRMLADRATQLEADQEENGHPSTWQKVYGLMQCPGPPCALGPHCWRDPFGKKHYKLRTNHLKALIDFVERGNMLQNHDDVPEDIREQLFAEEQQRLERGAKLSNYSTPFPPINITNVLPPSTHESPSASSSVSTTATDICPPTITSLDIPGARDVAVRMYTEWQQSQVADEVLKAEFRKARDVALNDGLDLEQLYGDRNPKFFVQNGVKIGVARRFISDIQGWVQQYKLTCERELCE